MRDKLIILMGIIGLAISLMLFVVLMNVNYNEPHFKITREECWNETNFESSICIVPETYQCFIEKQVKNTWNKTIWEEWKKSGICVYGSNIKDYFEFECKTPTYKQICKDVEVDEMFVCDAWLYEKRQDCLESYQFRLDLIGEEIQSSFYISKSELTLEWLRENCAWLDNGNKSPNRAKCGDYQVEVLR